VGSINADTALGEAPAAEPAAVRLVDQSSGATAEAAERVATVGAQSPVVAPKEAKSATKAARSKKSPTPEPKPKAMREGSKTAQVIALLQRNNGATLAEIMDKMGWQKTHRSRVHGRRDEEGRLPRRVLPIQTGRTHLPNQRVTSDCYLQARPVLPWRAAPLLAQAPGPSSNWKWWRRRRPTCCPFRDRKCLWRWLVRSTHPSIADSLRISTIAVNRLVVGSNPVWGGKYPDFELHVLPVN
jgi:hypothetical protein